ARRRSSGCTAIGKASACPSRWASEARSTSSRGRSAELHAWCRTRDLSGRGGLRRSRGGCGGATCSRTLRSFAALPASTGAGHERRRRRSTIDVAHTLVASILKALVVFGTRPEAVKLAPVIMELGCRPDAVTVLCATGQHREMLDQVLEIFDLHPDHDLDVMTADQQPCDV